MSGRHQPLHGADSASALDIACPVCDATYTVYETHSCPSCEACSLPAKPGNTYCVGHARLVEYHVTDENHWAANE